MRRYGSDCSFTNFKNNDKPWPIKIEGKSVTIVVTVFQGCILDLFGVKMDETSLNTIKTIESDVKSIQIEPMKISTYLLS